MKKTSMLSRIFFLGLVFLSPQYSQAQVSFQNGNVSCESLPLITGNGNFPAFSESIACKNVEASSDFSGDGFVDCASGTAFSPFPGPTPFPNLSILTNTGNTAPCAAGTVNQFNDAQNFFMPFLIAGDLGYVNVGGLGPNPNGGGGFDDVALAGVDGVDSGLETIITGYSRPAGGFNATANSLDDTSSAEWQPAGLDTQSSFSSENFEIRPSMALLDCDNDSDLDAVIAVRQNEPDADPSNRINILENDGTGLLNISSAAASFDTGLDRGCQPSMGVAVADFNNDGFDDVAVAVKDDECEDVVAIGVCLNDQSCGFSNCPPSFQVDIFNVIHPSQNASLNSIAAGDFNDDGNADVVVSEDLDVNSGVHYFFGNGTDSFSANQHINYDPEGGDSPQVLTTGCFNNDNVVDVAFSYGSGGASNVGVIVSDGMMGLNAPVTLNFDVPQPGNANGIDAADFDNQGGDDLIAISEDQSDSNIRQAFVFLNELETFVADAGPDMAGEVDVPLPITGASCVALPVDPNDPAIFDILWTVNPAVGASLTNADQINPTFTATLPGTYILTLECRSRCTTVVMDTKEVVVVGPTPSPTPTPTATPLVTARTQGGCLADLNAGKAPTSVKWIWVVALLLPLAPIAGRIRRRGLTALVLAFTLLFASLPAHALTTSFSVNSFEPTVDDSEYWTVYNSPTMLKRNFHVGFFLDYAHNPYEFGDVNFNRISGIVDSLLTGNILGSYGILDWFTIGLLIPVYFWEHIDSPTLLIDENNFDLGDIQMVLKFRLLDREKHHVGVAIVPFMVFPSSTGSADFLGNGSFSGGGKVVIDGRIKDRVSLALNLGYLVRDGIVDIGGNEINDQFLASLGISVDILRDRLKIIGEGQVATVVNDFFSSRRTTPAEARVGFRYTWNNNHDINVGAGFGLSNGIGSPDYRLFAGYTYTKRPVAEVAVPPAPIEEVNVGDELTLKDKIYFEFDKAVIRDISKPTLDKIAGFLKAHPEVTKIRIDGYTCDLGTDSYNLRLSQRRAKAAADYLIGQGIDPSRIGTVKGFGEANPLVPNVDEPHREQNRRVQIFVEAVNK